MDDGWWMHFKPMKEPHDSTEVTGYRARREHEESTYRRWHKLASALV
jgi:hypothetical protein